jgi:hypothetical protein
LIAAIGFLLNKQISGIKDPNGPLRKGTKKFFFS